MQVVQTQQCYHTCFRETSSIIQCISFYCSALFFLHLFLPRATHATPAQSITSLGFLTPGSLAGSILSFITNTAFKDSGLFCWYYDPVDLLCLSVHTLHTLWPQKLFIPQAVQLLKAWCWWWRKNALLLSPNIFLVTVRVTSSMFILLNHHLSLLNFGQMWFMAAHWKHIGVNTQLQMNTVSASVSLYGPSRVQDHNTASKLNPPLMLTMKF